jgi:hypothetical protein
VVLLSDHYTKFKDNRLFGCKVFDIHTFPKRLILFLNFGDVEQPEKDSNIITEW